MGRNREKTKTIFRQWGIPFVILLILVIAVLINFSVKGRSESTQRITEEKENEAMDYAERLYSELNQMTMVGIPAADVLGSLKGENQVISRDIQMALCNNTLAYQVIYADKNGIGKDQKGNPVNLSEEPYFQAAYQKQQYQYVEKDVVSNRSAIISILPVRRAGGEEKALYLYYPVERFQELYKNITYVKNSFCLLMMDEGSIVQSIGKNRLEGKDNQKLWNDLKKGTTEHSVLEMEDIEVLLTYAPVGSCSWYIVVGTDYSRIKSLISAEWKETRQVVSRLLIIIVAFIIYAVIISIINRMNYNKQNRTLEMKADTDLLTELYNKIATEREIQKYTQEHPEEKALLFLIDLDNFKKINDTMGHAFGDEVLRTIGTRLKVEFRQSDIIGRIGGDEMIVFLKNIQEETIMRRQMEKIRHIFNTMEVGEYVKYKVTASIGVAIFPQQGANFSSLYAEADKALYVAKGKGKDCMYCVQEEGNLEELDNLHRKEE